MTGIERYYCPGNTLRAVLLEEVRGEVRHAPGYAVPCMLVASHACAAYIRQDPAYHCTGKLVSVSHPQAPPRHDASIHFALQRSRLGLRIVRLLRIWKTVLCGYAPLTRFEEAPRAATSFPKTRSLFNGYLPLHTKDGCDTVFTVMTASCKRDQCETEHIATEQNSKS